MTVFSNILIISQLGGGFSENRLRLNTVTDKAHYHTYEETGLEDVIRPIY